MAASYDSPASHRLSATSHSQNRLARHALGARQVSLRDPGGRRGRRRADRRALLQPRLPYSTGAPGAHLDGRRPLPARVRPTHPATKLGHRRPGKARRAGHLRHRNPHHGQYGRGAGAHAGFREGHRSGSLSFLWRGHPRPAGRSARHPRQPVGRGFRRPAIPAEDARGGRPAARWPGLSHRGAAGIGARPLDGSINVGPRVMNSRQGLERTGLIGIGSRAAERYLFLLPPGGPDVQQVRNTLKQAFPEGLIADYRETHPIITRGLERSTTFLSLISLIALIVGALGVATAMHAHLQQKMDTIAILKCLGARSGQVLRIYLAQTLALGLAGGVLGVAFGKECRRAFPARVGRFFPVPPHMGLDLVPAAQGLAIGILTTLLFTLPTLLGIREIRPAVIFRREMTEARPDWLRRWSRSREALLTAAAILVGIGLIAAWLAGTTLHDSLRIGAYFAGGLLVSLLVIAAVAWALLRGLRR